MVIVIHGNPVDGLNFVGPFNDTDEAIEFAEKAFGRSGDWWVTEIDQPEEYLASSKDN